MIILLFKIRASDEVIGDGKKVIARCHVTGRVIYSPLIFFVILWSAIYQNQIVLEFFMLTIIWYVNIEWTMQGFIQKVYDVDIFCSIFKQDRCINKKEWRTTRHTWVALFRRISLGVRWTLRYFVSVNMAVKIYDNSMFIWLIEWFPAYHRIVISTWIPHLGQKNWPNLANKWLTNLETISIYAKI